MLVDETSVGLGVRGSLMSDRRSIGLGLGSLEDSEPQNFCGQASGTFIGLCHLKLWFWWLKFLILVHPTFL